MATMFDGELTVEEMGDEGELSEGPMVDGALALQTQSQTSATAITREQRRSRRKREVRARTISVKRMTKRELEIGRMLYPETDYEQARVCASTARGARPCPYVSCKHHLFLDVSARTGAIKLNFPGSRGVGHERDLCARRRRPRGHHARRRRRDHEPHPRAHSPGRGEGARQAPGPERHDGAARLRRRGPGRQAPPALLHGREVEVAVVRDEDDEDEDEDEDDEVDAADADERPTAAFDAD
jgi:hypothetical protein